MLSARVDALSDWKYCSLVEKYQINGDPGTRLPQHILIETDCTSERPWLIDFTVSHSFVAGL